MVRVYHHLTKTQKKNARKRRVKRNICLSLSAVIIVVTSVVLSGEEEIFAVKQQSNAVAVIGTEEVSESAQKEKIMEALGKDKFGSELVLLYEKYPEAAEVILNRDSYPDWLIEYWIHHEEAVQWVVDYPEYADKPAKEIDQKALESIRIEDYDMQGEIPVFYQWDQTWGYASYGAGTVATEGCGPSCIAMVVTGLTKDMSMTPKKAADFSMKNGYYTEDAGTAWELMQSGAQALGLKVIEVRWEKRVVLKQLKAGNPIICSMGPGDFTQEGHFVVLTGVTKDGKIKLNDPNSRKNTEKTWDAQELLDQMKSMWAYKAK